MSRSKRSSNRTLLGLAFTVPILLAGLLTQPGEARRADLDLAFLDRETAALDAILEESPETETGVASALDQVRRILDRREAATNELGTTLSLSGFDGIETLDQYDRAVVYALDATAQAGLDSDPSPAAESQVRRFDEVMGTPPELGDKPIAFMVVELAKIAVTAADLLEDDPTVVPPAPAKVALRKILDATSHYRHIQEDLLFASKAEGLRQSSVVLRMRCPEDGATYKVNTLKNKVGNDGEISTIYFLQCTFCQEPFAAEFPLELATRINQASERQKLKTPPRPTRPNQGLKP